MPAYRKYCCCPFRASAFARCTKRAYSEVLTRVCWARAVGRFADGIILLNSDDERSDEEAPLLPCGLAGRQRLATDSSDRISPPIGLTRQFPSNPRLLPKLWQVLLPARLLPFVPHRGACCQTETFWAEIERRPALLQIYTKLICLPWILLSTQPSTPSGVFLTPWGKT